MNKVILLPWHFDPYKISAEYGSRADMQKDNFLTQTRLKPKIFYPKKCVNCDKNEYATTHCKI